MEIEIKAKVKSFKKIKQNLKKLGAKKIEIRHQVDNYYLPCGCRLKTNGRRLFRTRFDKKNKKIRLESHRYLNKTTGLEHETEVGNKQVLEDILKDLKFKKIVSVEKLREAYKFKKIEIVLDKVKGLGNFVEVEILGKDSESNKKKLISIINFLEIPRKNIIWEMRYHSMMMKKKGYKHFYF